VGLGRKNTGMGRFYLRSDLMHTEIHMDEDVQRVCEFMQANMSADKLKGVAEAVNHLAPILWGHYGRDPVAALSLNCHPIGRGLPPQSSAIELESGNISEVSVEKIPRLAGYDVGAIGSRPLSGPGCN